MKIIFHFPGKVHKEFDEEFFNISFKNLINHIATQETLLKEYLNEKSFYSRYITFRNGKRFYNFNTECKFNDFILIIAANKIKKVDINKKEKQEHAKECIDCGNNKIVYVDNHILFQNRESYLCKNCFKKRMKEKIFNNISHLNLTNESIIDFGISGERDSTIALYFLVEYRKMTKMKFKINCVFNAVGLGKYDEDRLNAAKDIFKKLCFKNDEFNVNNLEMNFEEDFQKNQEDIDLFSTKYCSICTRANGFRNYGIYNGKDLFTASGSGTIEDNFTNKIMNKGETLPTTIVSSKFPKIINFRRMLILDGILEDMISIYAALENIDYCVADCPLACVSPNYLCRESSLNSIKAKTNWLTSAYGDNNLMQDCSILGRISNKRKVPLKYKCICAENGEIYGIKEFTMESIIEGAEERNKPDELEAKFYNICCDSKRRYMENNFDKYLRLFSDEYIKNIDITLNNIKIQKIKDIHFLFNGYGDSIDLININNIEKKLLLLIEKNERIKFSELIKDKEDKFNDNVRAIQNLLSLGIIKLNLSTKKEKTEERKLYIIDKEKTISKSYYRVLQDIFDVNKGNIICEDNDIYLARENDIILVIESDSYKIKKWYDTLKKLPSQVIYIHLFQPMTIFTNDYEYIEKNWTINMRYTSKLSIKQKNKYKAQLISVLSEIMLCDFNIIKNYLKKYNVLYYINVVTGEKKKQLF